jgi:hypothetical protein
MEATVNSMRSRFGSNESYHSFDSIPIIRAKQLGRFLFRQFELGHLVFFSNWTQRLVRKYIHVPRDLRLPLQL